MRFKMLFAVGLALLSVGCGTTKILETSFSSGTGSPAGSIPGTPTDDHITVQSNSSPTINAGNLEFNSNDRAYFHSRPVDSANSTKTVFFVGKLTGGSGPYKVWFQGGKSTPGNPFPQEGLELSISTAGFKLRDTQSSAQLQAGDIVNGADHQVFVSLRLGSGTYSVSIKQTGAAEISWTGNLNANSLNFFKANPRVVMFVGRTGGGGYIVRSVLMREK